MQAPPLPDGTALDCGAGIGRVAQCVLLPRFSAVELVEPIAAFADAAVAALPAARLVQTHRAPLQNFAPAADARYAVVWVQWVLNYLTDADLVRLLQRCAGALADGGRVVVKESVVRETAERHYYADLEDGSITRSDAHFERLFGAAGLRVAHRQLQPNFPAGAFPVWMYALCP